MNKYFRKFAPHILVLVLVMPAAIPLFKEGFFNVHDNTQVQRVYEMGKVLGEGTFPVRWIPDLGYGYGYPLFNFYAPLAYYFGGILTLIGLNALVATKLMFLAGILLSSITMFALGRRLWGLIGGLVASVFYTYGVHNAINIYIRGDVGEFWAYSFIPLVFLSIYLLYKENKLRYAVLGGISYAAVILSHNLTAFMLTPFMVLASLPFALDLIRNWKTSRLMGITLIFLIGILISSFYWLPAIAELKYTNVDSIIGGGSDFRDHFVCLNQLWSSPWGYGGSNPGCLDGISFKLGKAAVILSLISLSVAFLLGKKEKDKRNIVFLGAAGLIISLFLVLPYSRLFWEVMKPMEFLQFPWRFLLLSSFFLALICGSLFYFINKKLGREFTILLSVGAILLLMVSNLKLFAPQRYNASSASSYVTKESLFITSKISDEYMPKDFSPKPHNLAEVSEEIAYFPAWEVYADGKKIQTYSDHGRLAFKSDSKNIEIKFVQTPIEKIANVLSLVGIGLAFTVIIYERKRYENA